LIEGSSGARTVQEITINNNMYDCVDTPASCYSYHTNNNITDVISTEADGEVTVTFQRAIVTNDDTDTDFEFLLSNYITKCWPLLLSISIGEDAQTSADSAGVYHQHADSYIYFYDENVLENASEAYTPDADSFTLYHPQTTNEEITANLSFAFDNGTVDVSIDSYLDIMAPRTAYVEHIPWFGLAFPDSALHTWYDTVPTGHSTDYMVASTHTKLNNTCGQSSSAPDYEKNTMNVSVSLV
jgi:hypothetical protein